MSTKLICDICARSQSADYYNDWWRAERPHMSYSMSMTRQELDVCPDCMSFLVEKTPLLRSMREQAS